jgi:hypothetical protein
MALSTAVERIEAALSETGAAPATPLDTGGRMGPWTPAGLRDLQDLDLMRQILDDAARLLTHVADSATDQPLDPATLRSALRLRSLADRLLDGDALIPSADRSGGGVTFL